MIPVDQIRTGFGRGQCTEASIASLLGIPLADVPDLWAGPDAEEQQPQSNRIRMWEWMKSHHGVMQCAVQFAKPMPILEAWEFAMTDSAIVEWGKATDGYHLADGDNPDGCAHYVVCRNGAMVHDPNPRRRGIVAAAGLSWLIPLGLVPEDARELPAAVWTLE